MRYNIRCMQESDINNVYAIENDVHITPWSRDILRDCVLIGYQCFVLEITMNNDLIIVGYIICRNHNNCCHILNLGIAKSFQLKGYGRKLLEYILDSLVNSNDINQLMLEVRPSNNIALHLYEAMGFIRAEIKPDYYKDNNKTEDAILLKKNIQSIQWG